MTSALCNGEVKACGESGVENRGVCWATHSKPTISDSHTVEGGNLGSFSSFITNLIPKTTYYARAYAKNAAGIGYGEVIQFKTLDKPRIMGRVTGQGQGIADVLLTLSDNSSQARTDQQGYYNLIVDYGWSGIVTPQKYGCVFEPSSRTYNLITTDISNQDFTAFFVALNLHASRETESGWLITRQYGRINVKIDNPAHIPVIKYLLLKKESEKSFKLLQAIPAGQMQGDTYLYLDKYLDKTKTYTYKFLALDSNLLPIAASNEVTI
jgi:hypothetical protein